MKHKLTDTNCTRVHKSMGLKFKTRKIENMYGNIIRETLK